MEITLPRAKRDLLMLPVSALKAAGVG